MIVASMLVAAVPTAVIGAILLVVEKSGFVSMDLFNLQNLGITFGVIAGLHLMKMIYESEADL